MINRQVRLQWNLRQLMADRGMFQTSELIPLLAERGVHLSREHVYRLVTKEPQRINVDVLAALCDALSCSLDDLMTLVIEQHHAQTASGDLAGAGRDDATPRPGSEGGPGLGAIRPVRARVRRPSDQ